MEHKLRLDIKRKLALPLIDLAGRYKHVSQMEQTAHICNLALITNPLKSKI